MTCVMRVFSNVSKNQRWKCDIKWLFIHLFLGTFSICTKTNRNIIFPLCFPLPFCSFAVWLALLIMSSCCSLFFFSGLMAPDWIISATTSLFRCVQPLTFILSFADFLEIQLKFALNFDGNLTVVIPLQNFTRRRLGWMVESPLSVPSPITCQNW